MERAATTPIRLPSGVVAAAVASLATLTLVAFAEPASAGCKNGDAKPRSVAAGKVERAIVCEVNARREKHGLGKLSARKNLAKPAAKHTRYMQKHDCFAHVCPGEADVSKRLLGYLSGAGSWGYGENIAWGELGRGTPHRIVKAWMRSPEHRRVILTKSYEHIGVGVRWGSPFSPKSNAATATADFGYANG